jgi:hypothetical protein
MPQKANLGENEYLRLHNQLIKRNYHLIGYREFHNKYEELGLVAPRKREGREAGYRQDKNGMTAILWITYDLVHHQFRESDAAWLLICNELGNAVYFSGPIHRTQNFVRTIGSLACIGEIRLHYWPYCPDKNCKARMKVATGKKNPKQKYFECDKFKSHLDKKPLFRGWDYGIPWDKYPLAYKFVLERRRRRAVWRKKLQKEGKPLNQAMKKRKKWLITKPENIRH